MSVYIPLCSLFFEVMLFSNFNTVVPEVIENLHEALILTEFFFLLMHPRTWENMLESECRYD